MTEKEWAKNLCQKIEVELKTIDLNLYVSVSKELPYTNEILEYDNADEPFKHKRIRYQTDILIFETMGKDKWKPRIVIETKLKKIDTHNAITYSQKSQTHKNVHPYLRYGILIGELEHLSGRLFRHGQYFDFMQSWESLEADDNEWNILMDILKSELETSKIIEEIIYNSRAKDREKFTALHKPLVFKRYS